MWCVAVSRGHEFRFLYGPFLNAQDAARWVAEKFTVPLGCTTVVTPMIDPATYKGPEFVPYPDKSPYE